MNGAPGELAVTDVAATGRSHAPSLTHRIRWEIIVQHEGLLAGAFETVDELFVFRRAQGADHQRLRLAAREQRGAMGARQYPDFGHDRADRDEVASVDALLGVEHRIAHDFGFEVME